MNPQLRASVAEAIDQDGSPGYISEAALKKLPVAIQDAVSEIKTNGSDTGVFPLDVKMGKVTVPIYVAYGKKGTLSQWKAFTRDGSLITSGGASGMRSKQLSR